MAVLPTGTVTFLFTDIEGSTQMWERDARGMQAALARHDEILNSAIESNGGFVFKTMGDAFCAAFSSAPEALGAAISAQRALGDEEWQEGATIRVRFALHTGAVDEQGGDYFGPPLNRVSRLLSAGHGGQTLLSLATQELVRDALPDGARLDDLGERRLKDLFRPEHVFQITAPDLPSEFPPLRTLESLRNNLPLQPTPLVGREREVGEVCERLRQEEVRLLTLTGPGGTGKTRLALQAAADVVEYFEDGVFFVALSDINDTEFPPHPPLQPPQAPHGRSQRPARAPANPPRGHRMEPRPAGGGREDPLRQARRILGGRTLEAIEAICDAEGDLPVDIFDGVSSLLEKSLLRQEQGPEDEPRFVMLETIHEYAREKLEQSGEAREVKQAHAEYFLSLAEEAEPELVGPDQVEWMDRLEAEHDNLRAALSLFTEGRDAEPALRMAGALSRFWSVRGHSSEGRGWCEEALARDAGHASPVRAKALQASGMMAWRQSDYKRAEQRLEESLALCQESGDGRGEARSLRWLGLVALDLQDLDRSSELLSQGASISKSLGDKAELALTLNALGGLATSRGDLAGGNTIYEEAQGLARMVGNIHALADATNNIGSNAILEGDYQKARVVLEEASELYLALKDRLGHAITLHYLGLLALLSGDPDQAAILCAQSIETSVDLLDRLGVTLDLDALAAVSGERGDVRRAAQLWGAAEALRDAIGVSQPDDEAMVLESFVEAARSRLDEAAFQAAWEEGRAMTQEQAVALALEDEGSSGHTAEAEPA